jgi:hypothetical protein
VYSGPALQTAVGRLAAHLHATACTSHVTAQRWAESLSHYRAAACLVTDKDVTWYRDHVVATRVARRHAGVTAARVIATAFHHASLLLRRVWVAHAAALADYHDRCDHRTEMRAERSARLQLERDQCAARRPLPQPEAAAEPNRLAARGRCKTCLSVASDHVAAQCDAHVASLDRVTQVLHGASTSLAPGLAHAAPLS